MRIYSSTDGGRSWTTVRAHPPPAKSLASCSSDPGVAIDAEGPPVLLVRAGDAVQRRRAPVRVRRRPGGPGGRVVEADPRRRAREEPGSTTSLPSPSTCRPSSPHRGRVYLAWTRIARNVVFSIVLSHSDNGGRTWSKPVKVNEEGRVLTYATVATGPTGAVYVAWDDVDEFGIWMARSTDGGAHFRDHPQGGVLRGSHDPALRLGNRHSRAAADLRQLESHRLGRHLAWPLLGTRLRELRANGVSRPPGGAHCTVRPAAPADRAGSRDA